LYNIKKIIWNKFKFWHLVLLLTICCFIFIFYRPQYGQIIRSNALEDLDSVILITPVSPVSKLDSPNKVFLINKRAQEIHSWILSKKSFVSMLDDDRNLWSLHICKECNMILGEGDEISKYNWSGKLMRTIKGHRFVRDFDILPDDHIAAISLENNPAFLEHIKKNKYSERLLIFDSRGEIVWDWSIENYLNNFTFTPKLTSLELSYFNSIRYTNKNPINQTPALIVSARNFNSVFILEIKTKKILWISPNGLFNFQHDATLLENGNLLVFNNGVINGDVLTSVVEINPKTNKIVQNYNGGGNWRFMISTMGSAQRLNNGNTLISTGASGQIFEINGQQNVVWNYLLPIRSKNNLIQTNNYWQSDFIYRARMYNLSKFKAE
jgi:hypothetical protein